MSREERPRAKPRRPRVSEDAAAALEERIAASEAPRTVSSETETPGHPDVQTSGDVGPSRADTLPAGPGIIERRGRITSDGRRGARLLRRMTVYIPPDVAQRLELRALQLGRDRSSLITEAVAAFLDV